MKKEFPNQRLDKPQFKEALKEILPYKLPRGYGDIIANKLGLKRTQVYAVTNGLTVNWEVLQELKNMLSSNILISKK